MPSLLESVAIKLIIEVHGSRLRNALISRLEKVFLSLSDFPPSIESFYRQSTQS